MGVGIAELFAGESLRDLRSAVEVQFLGSEMLSPWEL